MFKNILLKNINLLIALTFSSTCYSQWSTLNIPLTGRYEDLCFINDSVGWTAGGGNTGIYKTTNKGFTWFKQFPSTKYLRSIEFTTPLIGFCGSLDSSLYKTIDGGTTWIDIANSITPKPKGICGLSAPNTNVIYGCGFWASPAYIIKSVDGGNTWASINMSGYANALVDIHFISADTGFVTGMANPTTDGGIVLYTTDGGATWSVKHKTMIPQDMIWKIQSPDGRNYFGSIESIPANGNIRIIKSINAGASWNTQIVANTYETMQMVGFIDSLTGWTGGRYGTIYETIDGGSNWHSISVGDDFNRFLKINDSTAYLTGHHIYKYTKGNTVGNIRPQLINDIHKLSLTPNPAKNFINIKVNIGSKTNCTLELFSTNGTLLKTIYDGRMDIGKKEFTISTEKILPQTLYLVLKTNEGLLYEKIIKM
jgi:photosystem II stability/assembly factor-like uncharacterized protein